MDCPPMVARARARLAMIEFRRRWPVPGDIDGDGFAYRAWRLHAAPMWLFNQLRRARNDVREHWLREYWKRNHRRDAV
jgi:hypothetical protein